MKDMVSSSMPKKDKQVEGPSIFSEAGGIRHGQNSVEIPAALGGVGSAGHEKIVQIVKEEAYSVVVLQNKVPALRELVEDEGGRSEAEGQGQVEVEQAPPGHTKQEAVLGVDGDAICHLPRRPHLGIMPNLLTWINGRGSDSS